MEYDVQSYASCTEVEQALHQSVIPALILLDVRISGARGEDVAKILHANEKTKHVPIITLSAHMDIAEKAKEANAVDYLAKPFDIMQLEHIVKKHIQK
jgi:two-component system cell cycle response regulator DivK